MSEPLVHEHELHALVDGQLPDERIAAVLEWLAAHPEDAVRVAQWQAQRLQLRRLHRQMMLDDTPAALTQVLMRGQRPRPAWQALAAGVVLGAGIVAAGAVFWAKVPGAAVSGARPADPPAFAYEAAVAHVVFTPEARHPVEVSGADEAHLVQWLGRRLGATLKVPVLQGQGFRLLGGRLLPAENAPRAQFMYEDARGRRLTLYLTVFGAKDSPGETAFRSARQGDLETFYWVEGRFGYALSAELPATELQALARLVYQQLDGAVQVKP